MTRVITTNKPGHRLWVAMRLGLGADAFLNMCGSVALEEEGQILAAVVYTNFQRYPTTGRGECWASIAAMPGSNWCTRGFVQAIVSYPFETLGVYVVRTMHARDNADARRFNEKLGLRRAGACRRAWDGYKDAIVYDMLPKEAAKWLGYTPEAWKEAANG